MKLFQLPSLDQNSLAVLGQAIIQFAANNGRNGVLNSASLITWVESATELPSTPPPAEDDGTTGEDDA